MVFLLRPNALQLVINDESDVPHMSCNNTPTFAEVNAIFHLFKDHPEAVEEIAQKTFRYDVGAKTDVVISTDTYDPDSLKVRKRLRWSTCVDIRCSNNIKAFLRNDVNKESVPLFNNKKNDPTTGRMSELDQF